VLVDGDGRTVASTPAADAPAAREVFIREGQTGVRVKRAEVAPYEGPACEFCGKHNIDPENDYQYIHAWRKKRHGTNSANFVRLIEPQGRWACRFCIDRMSNGLNAGQESLI